jgi:hypothetical protein
MSELLVINKKQNLIVCFGGMALKMGGIPPFEFLNYLRSVYSNDCDLIFYIDKHQCCYHKGIQDISNNVDETVIYLNNKISQNNYDKVIFMGTSAGGYAAILFGSLCSNINNVISFIPKTILTKPIDKKYSNLYNLINSNTNYTLFGDVNIKNVNDDHHISQCENLKDFPNVKILKINGLNLKKLRDTGVIKNTIDDIIYKMEEVNSY